MVKTELSKLEELLEELKKSWSQAKRSMDIAKEAIKKQFDKKRRNPQGLRIGDNMWLETKNIHLN